MKVVIMPIALPSFKSWFPFTVTLLLFKGLTLTFFCKPDCDKFFQIFISENVFISLYCLKDIFDG